MICRCRCTLGAARSYTNVTLTVAGICCAVLKESQLHFLAVALVAEICRVCSEGVTQWSSNIPNIAGCNFWRPLQSGTSEIGVTVSLGFVTGKITKLLRASSSACTFLAPLTMQMNVDPVSKFSWLPAEVLQTLHYLADRVYSFLLDWKSGRWNGAWHGVGAL